MSKPSPVSFHWGGENDQSDLLEALRSVDFLIAHNAKFELGWLRRCGLDLRDVLVYDTFLAEWVLLGNNASGKLSLESCVERRLPGYAKEHVGNLLVHTAGLDPSSQIPKDWLLDYCAQDVLVTSELARKQLAILADRNQLHLAYQRGLTCACLADIEFNGLRLDKEAVNAEHAKVLAEYIETKNRLETYGDINWRSPKQVAEFIYDTLGFKEQVDRRGNPVRTASGNRQTSKEAIAALVPSNERQVEFVELYKKVANLNARLTKTLDFFKAVCEHHNETFYGTFNQGVTATHRLSSSGRPVLVPVEGKEEWEPKGIQLQNLPREYKKFIRAKREGWLVLESDEAQLEFRTAAELGHDEVATEEIRNGVDIHSITAATLTRAGERTERQAAKSRTFRPLYGGRSGTKAERAYCKFFQNKYQGIYKTQEGWTWQVAKDRNGELITPYGMRFYWPGTRITNDGYIENTTSIFNFPIQGFATGEIVPLALVSFWHRTKGMEVELTNTVHDSIVAEVSPKDAKEAKHIAELSMTSDVYMLLEKLYNYNWTVPLGVEVKLGTRWGLDDANVSS